MGRQSALDHRVVDRGGLLDRFDALQSTLTIRVRVLEARGDDLALPSMRAMVAGYVRTACALRQLLARVLVMAPSPWAVPEKSLLESVRWTYVWAIEQIEAVHALLDGRSGGHTDTVPRKALTVFNETARRLDGGGGGVWRGPSAKETLLDLDETLFRMTQMQDWIGGAAASMRA